MASRAAVLGRNLNGLQRTAALSTALEIDLFTAVSEGHVTWEAVAGRCGTTARGTRVLCNYLALLGFLNRRGPRYELTAASGILVARQMRIARRGTPDGRLPAPSPFAQPAAEPPVRDVWVQFARVMGPVMTPMADGIARLLAATTAGRPRKVLDLGAGHGAFGIAVARHYRHARVVAVDWPNVLRVAHRNAVEAGVAAHYELLPGNVLDVDLRPDYDLVLLGDMVDTVDPETGVRLLTRARDVLTESGRIVLLGRSSSDPSSADCKRMLEQAALRCLLQRAAPPTDLHVFIASRADAARDPGEWGGEA